ncbi:MAG: ribosome maturation factor RimM [Clostridiales bacterium]|nr:ribosome maturation factor RimM [Clostridiales bacterium]
MPDNELILVGVIRGAHGVHGLLKVESLSDNPARFVPGGRLYACLPEQRPATAEQGPVPLPLTVVSASPHSGKLLLACAEITSREEAAALLGAELMALPDAPQLPAGQYYHYQLLDMAVYDRGEYAGRITEILSRPANDIYVMQNEAGEETWVPALKAVVKSIDLKTGRMEVELPEEIKSN